MLDQHWIDPYYLIRTRFHFVATVSTSSIIMMVNLLYNERGEPTNYAKQSYSCGWKISVKIISADLTILLVEVNLTWVQDPRSSPKSSWRLPTNTLNISCGTKTTQNKIITPINFQGKQLLSPALIIYLRLSMCWKLMWPTLFLIMRISVGSVKLLWHIVIGLLSVITYEPFDQIEN